MSHRPRLRVAMQLGAVRWCEDTRPQVNFRTCGEH